MDVLRRQLDKPTPLDDAFTHFTYLLMCGQVWKRAIAEAEDNLREMNRLVSEKMSHQQRLIDKLEQYVRIHNKLAASADNSSSSNQEETSDNSEQQEQDALSAQLSSLLDSLKAMTADSVQVSITASLSLSSSLLNVFTVSARQFQT